MRSLHSIFQPLKWLAALLLVASAVGCGNGQSPILGKGGLPLQATLTDTSRPFVSFTIPANTAATAAINASITATFNESMAASSVTAATTFTVKETVSGTNVPGATVTYNASNRTAVFNPSAALTPSLDYTATITTAATDLAGNALAGVAATPTVASNHIWTFTTTAAVAGDTTAPTVTLTAPTDAATNVSLNTSINATFSEAMDQATITTSSFTLQLSAGPGPVLSGTVVYDPLNKIATFRPTSNLLSNTQYTATVTAVAADLSGNLLVVPAVGGLPKPNPWIFTTGTGLAPGAVALGSAATFGIMATSAITSTGNSIINGDVSLDPGTSMTGIPPAIINGSIHVNDSVSAQARNDLLSAYNFAKGLPIGTTISGGADLGSTGLYPAGMPPGTYTSGSTMLVSSPLTLDAGGNANAVWVFQIGSSLTTTANVLLANGAQAKNVFWVPTSDATIGVGSTFEGTIVSGRDVTAVTGATINGRILAGAITAGTIALQSSVVNVPAP
jgi:hypothetical protein